MPHTTVADAPNHSHGIIINQHKTIGCALCSENAIRDQIIIQCGYRSKRNNALLNKIYRCLFVYFVEIKNKQEHI